MTIYQPYVYIIRWTRVNKCYIGVRFAKNCCPSDLFVSYFTSSKTVKQLISEVGLPDQIKIFRYADKKTALRMEEKFQQRFRVLESDYWLNRAISGTRFHVDMTEKHKKKISKANLGKPVDPETRKKLSLANRGKEPWNKGKTGVYSEETIAKKRQFKGNSLTPEHKERLRLSNLGNDHMKGKVMPLESKEKISLSKQSKEILTFVKGDDIFTGTRSDFQSHTGIPRQYIYRLISGGRKSLNGWKLIQ